MHAEDRQHPTQAYATSWILLLALLTAFGPLSIDMYLPALPQMAHDFGVSTQMISNSVPAYFLGLALGQLFYGPWSDRIGRKTPLYVGLILYSVASLACAFSPNEWSLIAARIFQALGGCVGVVIARAAIRDRLDNKAAANAFAHMMMVMTIAPIIAPAIGAWLIHFFHWQSIFLLLATLGLMCLLCVHVYFDETLSESRRLNLSVGQMLSLYKEVLFDQRFVLPMVIACSFSAVLFVYISSSASILMDGFGLSAQLFAYIFGANAVGILILSSLNKWLLRGFKLLQVVIIGAMVQGLGALLLLSASLFELSVGWVLAGFLCCVSGIGLTGPNSMALVMQHQQQRAGTASALMGSVQYIFGLSVGALVNFLPNSALLNAAVLSLFLCVLGMSLIWQMHRSV